MDHVTFFLSDALSFSHASFRSGYSLSRGSDLFSPMYFWTLEKMCRYPTRSGRLYSSSIWKVGAGICSKGNGRSSYLFLMYFILVGQYLPRTSL